MATGSSEACPHESPTEQLNFNRKRISHEAQDEQPAKRPASVHRMVTRQCLQQLSSMFTEQHDASSASKRESESDESAHNHIEQPKNVPQRYHSTYMTQSFPQVNFAPEMLRRVWFHVAVARKLNGHSYQMNLKEAMDATSFSVGVQRRLELLGYEIGSGVVVAHLDWIPTRSCLIEYSDHDALMWQIWDWPGWRSDGEIPFLNIYLVLEEKTAEVEV